MLPWPYPPTFLLETKRSIRPIPRWLSLLTVPLLWNEASNQSVIYGLKIGREMDWNIWGLSVIYWFEAAERVEETKRRWASAAVRDSLVPSPVTSIRQVRSSLPFPSSRAKTCTPYPNVSYLYSDLTQLQVYASTSYYAN